MPGLIDPILRKKIEEYQAKQPTPPLGYAPTLPPQFASLASQLPPWMQQGTPVQNLMAGIQGLTAPMELASKFGARTLSQPFRPTTTEPSQRPPTAEEKARGVFMYQPTGAQEKAYEQWEAPSISTEPLHLIKWATEETKPWELSVKTPLEEAAYLPLWMTGGRAAITPAKAVARGIEKRTPQLVKTALKEEAGMAKLPKGKLPIIPEVTAKTWYHGARTSYTGVPRGDIAYVSESKYTASMYGPNIRGFNVSPEAKILKYDNLPNSIKHTVTSKGKKSIEYARQAGYDGVEVLQNNKINVAIWNKSILKPATPKAPVTPEVAIPKAVPEVTPPVAPQPVAAVDKMLDILKVEKPLLRETGVLRHVELQKKAGMIERALVGGEPEAAMAQAAKLRGGKLPTAEGALREQFTPDEASQLFGAIRDSSLRSFEKLNANDAFIKLLQTNEPLTRSEIRLLGDVFGPEFVGIFDTLGRKAVKNLLDAANLPRAVLASSDLSATLRQGGILVSRRPYLAPKFVKEQVKYFVSGRRLQESDDLIRSHPVFKEFNELGGYMAPLPGKAAQLWKAEEAYMSRFAQHIPLVKQSERAFVGGLNWLRFNSYVHGRRLYEKMGVATEENLADLLKLITRASGRGDINLLKGDIGPIANAILFSPRLQLSRLQLPTMLVSKNPVTRKEAWKTMASFLAFGTGITSGLVLAGATVELDPRSSDFGKAKIGKTRLDFWTGFAQYARFLSQLATGIRKQTETGKTVEINRLDTIKRFIQSKLSPAAGLINDILQGTTFMGEEMSFETESLRKQAYNRLTPLFFQDMIDAISEEGLMGGITASAGFWGAGVVTHRPRGAPIIGKSPAQQIEDRVWAQYPQYKQIADQIRELEIADPVKAKALQRQYPQILNIRREILLAQGQQSTTDRQKALEQAMKQREAALAGR